MPLRRSAFAVVAVPAEPIASTTILIQLKNLMIAHHPSSG